MNNSALSLRLFGSRIAPRLLGFSKLPQLAAIRSMTRTQENRNAGKYHVRTGYDLGSRVIAHPSLGG